MNVLRLILERNLCYSTAGRGLRGRSRAMMALFATIGARLDVSASHRIRLRYV